MKSLQESLFDSNIQTTESLFDKDLVSKDTGLEYLYGWVKSAEVFSNKHIKYFNVKKIKHDFNELSKTVAMKPWSNNEYLTMDRVKSSDNEELLRELLYIIVTKISYDKIQNDRLLGKAIKKVIDDYVINIHDLNDHYVGIYPINQLSRSQKTISITFFEFVDGMFMDRQLGEILITIDK